MLVGIDHLVIAVSDPDAAALELRERLGLAATGGGRHDSGTWNRLIFLGDTYLELIGVWDAGRAAAHPIGSAVVGHLAGGAPGLATYALATDGLRREVTALHARGSTISQPAEGSRERADGARVAWSCAFPGLLGPWEPPFLIEHEMDGPEWGALARDARARFEHPFGGQARLVGLELVVPDPVALAAACAAMVGLRFEPAPDAGPGVREARVGGQAIRLVAGDPGTGGPASPPVRVGIRGTAGPRELIDAVGVRFARL